MKKVIICSALLFVGLAGFVSCTDPADEVVPMKEVPAPALETDGGDGDGDESNKPCGTCQ